MTKQSTRLPRFSRFEYVSDLLDTASEGADWDTIEKSLTKRKYEFERLKFSATGKGKRVLPKHTKSKDLTNDCISMAVKAGLITKNDTYHTTENGQRLCGISKEFGMDDIHFKTDCLKMYFTAYPFALDVLLAISKKEKAEIDFPDTRNVEHLTSTDIEDILGVKIDAVSMRNLRDIFDQSGLINWKSITLNDLPYWKIFLTCKIYSNHEDATGFLVKKDDKTYHIVINESDSESFENALWREYMVLAENNSDIPVYYWDLRGRVCETVRLPDHIYDTYFKKALSSDNLRMNWSAGAIPSGNTKGNLLKNLPPRQDNEFWMVYVSISKRE